MPGKFDKPSRLNLVSFIVFLALAAGVYSAIQFGPAYYRRWKAAGVVSEMVSKFFGERLKGGEGSTEVENRLRPELLTRLKEVGIDDTTVQATFRKSITAVSIEVAYREVIRHPFVNKTTTLEFTISEDAKKVKLE